MSNGFIKLQRSAQELFENDTDAFLLLTQIAFRALRKNSKYNSQNLQPGQALIGDYKSIGLTEQRYRDTKYRLEYKYKLISFKGTNKGTVATILDTTIYDINCEEENEQDTSYSYATIGTTKERTKNEQTNEQENEQKQPLVASNLDTYEKLGTNKKTIEKFSENEKRTTKEEKKNKEKEITPLSPIKKKAKEPLPPDDTPISVREWVKITPNQQKTLIAKYGQSLTDVMLDILDAYNTSRQKHYASDYGTMKEGGWVHHKALEKLNQGKAGKEMKVVSNKELACDILKEFMIPKRLRVELLSDCVEFLVDGAMNGTYVSYNAFGFKDQLLNAIQKNGCVKKTALARCA